MSSENRDKNNQKPGCSGRSKTGSRRNTQEPLQQLNYKGKSESQPVKKEEKEDKKVFKCKNKKK